MNLKKDTKTQSLKANGKSQSFSSSVFCVKKPLRIMRNRKKTTKKRFFSRADEKRICIGSADHYVTIINKTDAKVNPFPSDE